MNSVTFITNFTTLSLQIDMSPIMKSQFKYSLGIFLSLSLSLSLYIYIYIYIIIIIIIINNSIPCLGFNILHNKIHSYKFLNSLKYPYFLVK